MNQARFWLLTIRHADFVPYLPPTIDYLRGQLERGDGGFLHWQLVVHFARKVRLGGVKSIFGDSAHAEPTRSDAARDYVWKEDTAVANTRFELGKLPIRRGNSADWEIIRENAKLGRLDDIPGDIYCRLYNNLKRFSIFYNFLNFLESLSIIWRRLESSERLQCTGAALVQANLDAPGTKPVWTLTLKILGPSFGMDTELINMLSWTNFGVELISLTSYDGSTDTQSSLRLKVRVSSLPPPTSGLQATWTPVNGSLV